MDSGNHLPMKAKYLPLKWNIQGAKKSWPLLRPFAILFIYYYTGDYVEKRFFYENYVLVGGSLDEDPSTGEALACRLPLHLSPFDPSIMRYVSKLPSYVDCHQNEASDLTYIDEKGVIRMREQQAIGVECHYRCFDREKGSDDKVVYESKVHKIDPVDGSKVDCHFVRVDCNKAEALSVGSFYTNFHAWFATSEILNKTQTLKSSLNLPENAMATGEEGTGSSHVGDRIEEGVSKKSSPKDESKKEAKSNKPSVFFLIVESLSRLNYLRLMPKTQEALAKFDHLEILKGLTKLADNSYPNMVPLLTGKRIYYNELPNDIYGPYDDWPFIWKDFQRKGYMTSLIEDDPAFTLFNYLSKGFIVEPPTDWYPRPVWLEMTSYKGIWDQLSFCLNRKPTIDIWSEQALQFVRHCDQNDLPYFAFTFYIQVTHNDFNRVQLVDSHIAKLVSEFQTKNKDAIFILMGDHGHRFGDGLETNIGRIEERMPLFAIHLPKALNERFPHLKDYLHANNEALTTWLDIHEMLRDIVNETYYPQEGPPLDSFPKSQELKASSDTATQTPLKRGYSLWRELVPKRRTCEDALIPEHFCVCEDRKKLPSDHEIVRSASTTLIQIINDNLPSESCVPLSLGSVISADVILPNRVIAKHQGFKQRVEVTIVASPSQGIFRAQLQRTAINQKWKVNSLDEISRLNRYGNQSECLTDRVLRKFCLCSIP